MYLIKDSKNVGEEEVKKSSSADKSEKVKADKKNKAKSAEKADKKSEEAIKKQKELEETLVQKDAEISEAKDQYLRILAEYDNFKKRTIKEKEAIYIDSVKDTVLALLPVMDNLERALDSFSEEDRDTDFYKGVELVFKQTKETFEKLGVEEIKAVGEEFDPEKHNAVMHIEDETIADNTVVEQFQKGYLYRDKVIRYSMVKVAN